MADLEECLNKVKDELDKNKISSNQVITVFLKN